MHIFLQIHVLTVLPLSELQIGVQITMIRMIKVFHKVGRSYCLRIEFLGGGGLSPTRLICVHIVKKKNQNYGEEAYKTPSSRSAYGEKRR